MLWIDRKLKLRTSQIIWSLFISVLFLRRQRLKRCADKDLKGLNKDSLSLVFVFLSTLLLNPVHKSINGAQVSPAFFLGKFQQSRPSKVWVQPRAISTDQTCWCRHYSVLVWNDKESKRFPCSFVIYHSSMLAALVNPIAQSLKVDIITKIVCR